MRADLDAGSATAANSRGVGRTALRRRSARHAQRIAEGCDVNETDREADGSARAVIGAAIDVHRGFGPGQLEDEQAPRILR